MSNTATSVSLPELLPTLTNTISQIMQQERGLITVICPTNTTAVFLRRQYERSVGNAAFVRFSTLSEVTELLEDATLEQSMVSQSQSIHHFDTCVLIARTLFENSSPWIKAPLIRSTLEYLYTMDETSFDRATNDYEIVRACFDEFSRIAPRRLSTLSSHVEISDIIGTCVVIGFSDFDLETTRFTGKYTQYISEKILITPGEQRSEITACETPFDELDLVFSHIIDSELDLNTSCIIVPDNRYKRLVIETAQRKNIPLAGSSPHTLGSHPFCVLSDFFLQHVFEKITYDVIQDFVCTFPWLNNPAGKHPFIDCIDHIASAETVGEYFSHITTFIEQNVREEFFKEDNAYGIELSFTQDAFAVLSELATSTSVLSHKEAALFLRQRTNKSLRIAPLGEGLYVALPSEVFGCHFSHAFVCGMNDSYVTPHKIASSLIPRDQYEAYEINGVSHAEKHSLDVLTWLRCCADNFEMSSSFASTTNKATAFPHWAEIVASSATAHPLAEIDWDDEEERASEHLANIVSTDLNMVNALVDPELLKDVLTLSPTGLEDVAQCPSKFLYTQIFKARTPQTPDDPDQLLPAVLGTFVHEQLDGFIKNELSIDELIAQIQLHIQELETKNILPHNASAVLTFERLKLIVNNFVELHSQYTYENIRTEVDVTLTLENPQNVRLSGKVDRLHETSQTTLVDYKTGKLKTSQDVLHLGQKIQLAIYALMLNENVDVLQYWYLGGDHGETDAIEWTDETRVYAKKMLSVLSNVISQGAFIPREEIVKSQPRGPQRESLCQYCENEPHCYQEQRNLWPTYKHNKVFSDYSEITGENLFEEVSS